MKKIKWKIAAFVAWVVITLMVVDVGLRGVSKADTTTNIVSVMDSRFHCNGLFNIQK